MSQTKVEIAVVGAGPVGLAAALALEKAGYNVALIGPHGRGTDERTSALLMGSIAFLEAIAVWPALVRSAAPLRRLRIVDGTDRLIRAPEVSFESTEIGLEAFGYNVPNAFLISVLEAAVERSGIVRASTTAENISIAPESVRIRLSNGSTFEALLVVGADGRGSLARAAADIHVDTWRYDQAALVVNLMHSLPHGDASTEFHTATGPFTLVPLLGRRSSLVWVGSSDETNERSVLSDNDLAQAIEKRSSSILGTIEIDGRRQVFPLTGMTTRSFAVSRIALVGEAAHVFPPIGAQGLNLGYRDVGALAEIIAGPLVDPGAADRLSAFDKARRRDVISRTAAIDALNRTLLSDFVPIQGLRGLGLFLLDRVPPLRRAVMREGVGRG